MTFAFERLARELRSQRYGRSLHFASSTASTNDDAREAIARGAVIGHAIVADEQTRGRGSRGRSWQSPAGTDIYVSVVDRLPVALAELPPLTLAVGLGVAEAADTLLGAPAPRCQVKWPNDVWIEGKKCAGVLIETSVGAHGVDALVIGIGLNVNRAEFPEELQPTATSLRLARGVELDRTDALRVLLESVEHRVDDFVAHGAAATAAALTPRLALLGRPARCDGLEGTVRGVDSSGALLLDTAVGLRAAIAGRLEPIG
jgi:BirA family biotin operon repressor/biotin-[acetyl-CoA-carboxylase] ligase